MTTIDQVWQGQHRSMIHKVGVAVTFRRITGAAPNTTIVPIGGAVVTAIVREYRPDRAAASEGGYGAGQIAAVGLGDRQVIVMADELTAAGFPLPLQKDDQIIVTSTSELLVVREPDSAKRAVAGCIEMYAVGNGKA